MNLSDPIVDRVRLAPREQIGLHSHPAWELSLVVAGEGTRRMGDVQEPFAAGDLLLVPPDLPHGWFFREDAVDAQGCIENITVFFSDDFLRRSIVYCKTSPQPLERLLRLESSLRIVGKTAGTVAGMMRTMVGQSETLRIASLLSVLATIAESAEQREVGRIPERDKARIRMAEIDLFLRCNYARTITLDGIAARVGMNKSSFCQFFKRQTGKSFIAYVNDFRLSVARDLLADEALSVSEVCYRSGFNDIHYFSRLFRQRTGLPPKTYRERHGAE